MEIFMLSSYKHDNLVSLIGFCDQDGEKILVYEEEVRGSLDNYLASPDLTWEQRLRICLGAARGLDYLHNGVAEGHRVVHRDIKSSNILLDANWKAKISDFGLSKIGPRNQEFTFLISSVAGTYGYVDPIYVETGVLTKESDVYSFGIVLFEVMCQRLATANEYQDNRKFLSGLVNRHYENAKLHVIVPPDLRKQMTLNSYTTFCDIGLQCLKKEIKQRPTMGSVVKALETALDHQHDGSIFSDQQIGTRSKLLGSSTGGLPWLFQLQSNQKLRKITIYAVDCIISLAFTAEDSNGLLHSSPQYGGGLYGHNSNRGKKFEIKFDADEEIIGISGTIENHIASMCIMTTKKKYGPFGKKNEPGNHFSDSWDAGSFDGFYGRSGWVIDAVGCCLKPATI
ncbi:jacalin-like lectin domain-containing protein [Artemisia annua]|uniref:non-specific serine/threonine protein kinase n=1 Tax=Artemisia annua TaxID=35608 RepID=A0A2U1M4T5_ARTAN|nr:jacalin-like lectin domain-containing protein [Artemisia annua]